MKSSKYTFLIIPDSDDYQKRFTISRFWIQAIIGFLLILIIGVAIIFSIYVPRIIAFKTKEKLFDKMLTERSQVMEMYRDLNRLEQMENVLKKNLSIDDQSENQNETKVLTDSDHSFAISYIENIPSQAPVDGYLTQRMLDDSHFWQKNHYGIDIAVQEGEPVAAAASGRVIFSGWTYDLGYLIIIYHGDDYFTHYGHNQLNLIQPHGHVERGEIIALAGSTGISSGPHLHFEIWKKGRAIDPLVFFPEYSKKDLSSEPNG